MGPHAAAQAFDLEYHEGSRLSDQNAPQGTRSEFREPKPIPTFMRVEAKKKVGTFGDWDRVPVGDPGLAPNYVSGQDHTWARIGFPAKAEPWVGPASYLGPQSNLSPSTLAL